MRSCDSSDCFCDHPMLYKTFKYIIINFIQVIHHSKPSPLLNAEKDQCNKLCTCMAQKGLNNIKNVNESMMHNQGEKTNCIASTE
jgi:hypothetical protein